jgi:coenzyme F420-0:L-glutamate ligase/coenzyme F420-1:gamma-L-glutamate ligase
VRRFLADPVPEAIIAGMIQAATRAPSAHNRQPWRFPYRARCASEKAHLAQAMGDKLRLDRSKDGDDGEGDPPGRRALLGRINGAPALIAVCLTLDDMDTYPDASPQRGRIPDGGAEHGDGGADPAAEGAGRGLGACWMCAPLFCAETVRTALALPPSWQPQGLMLLGWPAEPGRVRERKPLGDIVTGLKLP